MDTSLEKWAALEKLAEYLGMSKDAIRLWIKAGKIPAHRIGRK